MMEMGFDELKKILTDYSYDNIRPIKPFPARAARSVLYLIDAMVQQDLNIEQMCGKVLGYPWYKDDHTNFPDATERDGVCVGDHVSESIVAELCNSFLTVQEKYKSLESELHKE